MSQEFMHIETGEIKSISSYRTEEQDQKYQEYKKREAVINKSNNPFVFTEQTAFEGGISTLKNKDLGYFLMMQTYVDYKNMLKTKANNKNPMSQKELAEALDITTKTAGNLIRKFEKLSLVYRDKVEVAGRNKKAIFIDSDYCFRKGVGGEFSNRKTDKAVKVFISSLQDAYKEGLQPADIGFIYKTIQFIHYDTNYLVLNPMERDGEKVQTLSLEGLAEVMALSVEETSRKLSSLTFDGMYIFGKMRIGKKELMIKANPLVLYRKAGEPDKDLVSEFVFNSK
ncbi:hypothetical protein [Halobacillus sp. B29]|uniref:hypothetical protein n=1 Tax=Halobacillus sp. B29 TaxID=3457432 RepID=UPI003FCCEC14